MLNQNNKASNLIDKLASNEESIARLYQQYADSFPDLRDFWISLAAEEIQHASWIRDLGILSETKRIFIDEHRFNTAAIETYLNYLDNETARLNEHEISLIEALSITLSIEQSLIESKFFEIFETDSAELKHTLKKILDDTISHRNKAKETLEAYKKNR